MEIQAVYETIGGNIRRARENREVTQSDLADALGVARTVVTNMETGRQAVKVHQLLVIASVLDVPTDELLEIDTSQVMPASVSNDADELPENLAMMVAHFQTRLAR